MEIVTGIHRVDEASANIAHSNVYLVINEKNLVVVDTGTPGNAKKIVEYIQKLGRQPTEVSTIILTHYHMDHAGSVKELKEQTGAKLAVGADDVDYVTGAKTYPKPKNLLMRAATSVIKLAPTTVDIALKDGEKIGDFQVLQTPGHTPGSIMLLDEKKKVLFSGDTVRFERGKITPAPTHFTWDEAKAKDSILKIAQLDFNVMLPGHGELLLANASGMVKEFSKTL